MKIKTIFINIIVFLFISAPIFLGATEATGLKSPTGTTDIETLFGYVLGAIVDIASVFGIFWLIWSGLLFVMAQGNPEKLKTAKLNLFWSLAGLVLLLGSKQLAVWLKEVVDEIMR